MPDQKVLHPNVEELTAFGVGQLPVEKARQVEEHVSECKPCVETLMQLPSDDTFVALLKDTKSVVSTEATAIVTGTDQAAPFDSELDSDTASALANHSRYKVAELIGKGGMGDVYKAEHRMMERPVALKVINEQLMCHPDAVERFRREVKAAARLTHPNIVTSHDAEQAGNVHFLVMEYVDGITLAELVKDSGPLPITAACNYIQQAANGLQHASEQGMVHRDIKPHNLMLTSDGTVKILDFGLASLTETTASVDGGNTGTDNDGSGNNDSANGNGNAFGDSSLTSVGTVMGTPDFISPEQAVDAHQADIRSDIYSLGATLHFLLSGKPPFADRSIAEKLTGHVQPAPESIQSLRSDVSDELAGVIDRMLAKDPDQRLQAPNEVAGAMAAVLDSGTSSPQDSAIQPAAAGIGVWWPLSAIKTTVLAACVMMLSGIIYIKTDQGTVSIDTIDDKVEVKIYKVVSADGVGKFQLDFVDTMTGSEVKRLPSGQYEAHLVGNSGYELKDGGFTLSRNKQAIVKVSLKPVAIKQPLIAMDIPEMTQTTLLHQGFSLTDEQYAEQLQKSQDDGDDLSSRIQLLGYYNRNSMLNKSLKPKHQELALWFIDNYPDSTVAGSGVRIDASLNPGAYIKCKSLWESKIEDNPDNVLILGNAANFHLLSDSPLAERLLLKAQKLQPDTGEWANRLAQHYSRQLLSAQSPQERDTLAKKSLAQFEMALKSNRNTAATSSLLVSLATAAFEAQATDKARMYAEKLVNEAEGHNASRMKHHGNIVLGRLAMQQGDVAAAKTHLLAAGDVSGSPTLNSFGPDMKLARELLKKDEREVVLQYFELCGKFWTMGEKRLKEWAIFVKGGGIPNF